MKKYALILSLLTVVSGCVVPFQPISQDGTLIAIGNLEQAIYEEDQYQLCFELTLDKNVLAQGNIGGSKGVETPNGLMYSNVVTACRPFYTKQDGSFEIYFNYSLGGNTHSGTAQINVTKIESYILILKGNPRNSSRTRTTNTPIIDVIISGYSHDGNVYTVNVKTNINTIRKSGSKNNVNINIDQH